MLDGHRLTSCESGLDHAVLIILTGLTGICVTEVDFNSRDLIAKVDKGVLHQLFDIACECFTAVDAVVCTDFDVHAGSCRKIPRK
jgi:hypothetical protein